MKRDKILTFGFAALFAAGLLSSCSQEDVAAGVDLHQENNKTVTVKELTERLKVYNANVYGVTRASQEPWMPNPELSTDLKMKIENGASGYAIPAMNLPSGIYQVTMIQNGNVTGIKKFVK